MSKYDLWKALENNDSSKLQNFFIDALNDDNLYFLTIILDKYEKELIMNEIYLLDLDEILKKFENNHEKYYFLQYIKKNDKNYLIQSGYILSDIYLIILEDDQEKKLDLLINFFKKYQNRDDFDDIFVNYILIKTKIDIKFLINTIIFLKNDK